MPAGPTDSFCDITDVEAVVQRGAFSGSTYPTDQNVLDAMQMRSAHIEGVLRAAAQPYTVPSGANPFPASPNAFETTLKQLCRQAVAAGAGAHALLTSTQSDTGAIPDKVLYWEKQWDALVEQIDAVCKRAPEPALAMSRTPSTDPRWTEDTNW